MISENLLKICVNQFMSSEARHIREESPDIQLRFIGARVVGNAHRQGASFGRGASRDALM